MLINAEEKKMKISFNKFKTLGTKIVIMLILFSVIPVIITGISSYQKSKKILSNKLETTSKQTISEINRGINNYFSAMSNLVNIIAHDSDIVNSGSEENQTRAKELITNINITDDNIINVYAGTESGLFLLDPIVDLPKDYDHKATDWYKASLSNPEKILITDPYVDTATGNMVVSITKAVMKDNVPVGVAGMDIDLATLSASLSDIKIGDTGYIYITDNNGIMIVHPDSKLIGTDIITTLSYWDEVKSKDFGFTSYDYEGSKKYATYDTSEITGWKVLAALNYSELSKDTSEINDTLRFVLILTILAAILLSFLFSTPISRNIKTLLTAFHRLAQGDLTTKVNIKSMDEFQLLGDNFNIMVHDIAKLIKNVNEASNTVLDTSITLSNMAEETNASIYEVTRAAEEVARGATEQAENASDGAGSVSELSEELDSIQKSTDYISDLSMNTSNLTLQGLQQVENLALKSELTMQSTAKVSQLVLETNESMKQIDAISNTIDAITAQTNLLALNASIEAARAGESGKGFAVVADEIRKLAEQSKNSTVKIKAIIEDIELKTSLSVEAMETTNHNVKEQVILVNETQVVFKDIKEAVQNLSDKVIMIKNNINEINDKKDNIVGQIQNISAISEESASATEEVTASTEQINITMNEITQHTVDLQVLSQKLQERINSFKF